MSSYWNTSNENDDENSSDEENNIEEEEKIPEDRIIFLIDSNETMKSLNTNNRSYIQNVLELALAMMKAKIIANDNSAFGITFYWTINKDENSTSEGIFTLMPLSQPTASKLREIQHLIDNIDQLYNKIGLTKFSALSNCPLKQAFWQCSHYFSNYGVKRATVKVTKPILNRIWIFSDLENPYQYHNDNEYDQMVRVAKDLGQKNIEISIWFILGVVHTFNPGKCYGKILLACNNLSDDEILSNYISISELSGFDVSIASIRKKIYKKRILNSTYMNLGSLNDSELVNRLTDNITIDSKVDRSLVNSIDNNINNNANNSKYLCISMRIYKLIQIFKKPTTTWLNSLTNEPIKLVSKYIDSYSGKSLDVNEIGFAINDVYGNSIEIVKEDYENAKLKHNIPIRYNETTIEKVDIKIESSINKVDIQNESKIDTDSEIKEKNISIDPKEIGIHILSFIPLSSINLSVITNSPGPYFVFPNDKSIYGSIDLANYLINSLVDKQLIGVVFFRRNKKAVGKVAYLVPQKEIVDEDENQLQAPGFQLIPLAFKEDLRESKIDNSIDRIVNDKVDVVKNSFIDIINDFKVSDDFSYTYDIKNPSIQLFYSVLQALALNEEKFDFDPEIDDTLKPLIDSTKTESIEIKSNDIKSLIQLSDEDIDIAMGLKKTQKRAANSSSTTAPKKAKVVTDLSNNTKADFQQMISSNEILSMSLAQLKDICLSLKIPVSGTKAALITRITAAVNT